MSLLEAVTHVASKAGYTVDTSVVGSSEVTTKQLLAMAQDVVEDMAEAYPWPKLFASGSITLVGSQAGYALPADFSWYHFDTFWNTSTRWRVLGPLSPQTYADNLGYGLNPSLYGEFQIRGQSGTPLVISPTPDSGVAGQIIIFEYIADRAVRPLEWSTGLSISSGRYIWYNGNYYTATTTGTTGATAPTHTSGSASDGGVTWAYYSGPYSEFLRDDDESVLPQRCLEQGMLEQFAEIHGLPVVPKFTDMLNEEYAKATPGKILYAGGNSNGSYQYARNGTVVFGRNR